ncbi:aminotransferase class V-fold PLP-dependent enzyme [Ekhidna sp. To15]|uniref:aminotransferase class V-fold PLP-dependent enzyme n=1 Tax=Ekhidna sp. To15 TaxID=3395267 RepID=UPI003F51AC62
MIATFHNHGSILTQSLEDYFQFFRENIIGKDSCIDVGERKMIRMLYADWTASGRCYRPLEEKLMNDIMPFIANTHTETNYVGSFITKQYLNARQVIKNHVNASDEDVLVCYGSGMTDVVNKFQRILGLRVNGKDVLQRDRPVVFVTHMEHHSNHTSWLETIGEVVVVPPDSNGLVSLREFELQLKRFPNRKKIAAITACSNVTGIETPYHEIAALFHKHGGYCFVDFACSAPYVTMNMHPDDTSYLDAIFFSPHKFLGGPGSSGILIFNQNLYAKEIPDVSGGGTVEWTNPWGGRRYIDCIEEREDGGTPAILQTIRASLAIQLKEQMGLEKISMRKEQLMDILWDGLTEVKGLYVLAKNVRRRLGIISMVFENVHFNNAVQMLNDDYGIQVRGGCSCAGTYGHYLLNISTIKSKEITDQIDKGNLAAKPGWVRLSIHPTMTDDEAYYILDAIREVAK